MDFEIEKQFGNKSVCGVDEVGRGCLAGPVIACAVKFNGKYIAGVNDSKKLSKIKREILNQQITQSCEFSIGEASVEEIEKYNILNATKLAMQRAVTGFDDDIEIVLVDGNMKFDDKRFHSIIKGDQLCYSIACASIVAKVYRDNLMRDLAKNHPQYSWEKNAAYGTKSHLEAIKNYGITIHHRKNFIK